MDERCTDCDSLTGREGKGDGSLYTVGGEGPFCMTCWDVTGIGERNQKALELSHKRLNALRENSYRWASMRGGNWVAWSMDHKDREFITLNALADYFIEQAEGGQAEENANA